MKAKDINIEKFKTIDDVYSFIDHNAFQLEKNWDLTTVWTRYKNLVKDDDIKNKVQWEIDCFLFDIKGNEMFSYVYSEANKNNRISKYPDIKEFNKEIFDYFKKRSNESSNSIIKARYNHILWKSPRGIKRNEYAVEAINNYIEAIKGYYELFQKDKKREYLFQIGVLYENLLSVGNEIKTDYTSIKELTIFLLFKANNIDFYIIQGILNDMLKYPKIFKEKDFENTLSLFDTEISSNNINNQIADIYFDTAIKIASKTKSNVKKWHNEKGLLYLRLAKKETKKERYFIKQNYHYEAIDSFKLAGNLKNREIAEKLYANLKPEITLPSFTVPYSKEIQDLFSIHNKIIEAKSKKILELDSSSIYRYISKGYLFPNYSEVKESSNSPEAFLDFVTNIKFDKNKNIKSPKINNKDIKAIFDSYAFYINNTVIPYLHSIIIFGIKSGKLTFENFISFLIEETWIGKPHYRYDISGERQEINWINLLSPSIVDFFIQVQAWGNSKYYNPSFILSIDSLTVKMEGVFRNFCERAEIPTSHSRKKGMQEAYLNNIFDNKIIIKYFNEDDRLLFNYLFSNDGGLNLRNNIAHCFYNSNEYSPDKMLLLLATILRLGKYDHSKIE